MSLRASPVRTVLTNNGLIKYLRAVAPGAKRPVGVYVLCSHTENILLIFDIDLKLSFLSGVVLHKRRGGVLKTKKKKFVKLKVSKCIFTVISVTGI